MPMADRDDASMLQKELLEKESEIDLVVSENKRLYAEIIEHEGEFEAQQRYIDSLKQALNTRAEDLGISTPDAGTTILNIAQLKEELAAAQASADDSNSKLGEAEGRLETARRLVVEMKGSLQQASDKIRQEVTENESLSARLESITAEVSELRSYQDQAQEMLASQTELLEERGADCHSLQERAETAEAMVKDLEARLSRETQRADALQ
ncbi:hypothetical protein KIPB_013493, partial [Kipferlia bialata]|eukprot:g13493.t1